MNSMPTLELRDSRAAVAGLVVDLPWVESFSYRFRYPQHINFLNSRPASASFEGWWTVVSEIVVCSVWSTAELFLDQCVRGAPAADVWTSVSVDSVVFCWQTICRLTCVGYLLGKPQRRSITFLLGKQVADRSR